MIAVPQGAELADVHEVVALLASALEKLGQNPAPDVVERSAFLIHAAMAGDARTFHTHEHVLAITDGADPISVLAGAFHDVVYVQVDRRFVGPAEKLLAPLVTGHPPHYRVAESAANDRTAALVLAVFGVEPGSEVPLCAGLNELASALAAAKSLENSLPERAIVEIAACIEATIPFRPANVFEALDARLAAIQGVGLDERARAEAVRRAVRLANRDVIGFAADDPAKFLHDTWQILPETNPALYEPSAYTVGAYRLALAPMEAFLSRLHAERIFHAFQDEPSADEHARLTRAAARNIAIGTRYLRAKLYAIALIEAISLVTGGDGPIDFFLGGLPRPNSPPPLRAERFLPTPDPVASDLDPELLRLLEEGRAGPSSCDMPTSPATAFLYRSLGERALLERLERARSFLRGDVSPRDWLLGEACPPVAALARSMSRVAFTRQDKLARLADELEGRR